MAGAVFDSNTRLEVIDIGSSKSWSPRHIPALDGIRGIAVLMIMFHHWTILQYSDNAFDRGLAAITHGGWAGVELFFVLSGFLITGILLDARGKKFYFRDFYARRSLRIFPLYYAFLLVITAGAVLPWHFAGNAKTQHGELPSLWWYWTYCSNFLIARKGYYSILDPTWSLAIEEQFYWVWPVVVLWLDRGRLKKLCWALLILSPVIRAVMTLNGMRYPALYVLLPSHMDGLLVGGLLAFQARSTHGLALLQRPSIVVAMISALVIATLTGIAWQLGTTVREQAWTQVPIYSAIALLSGAVLIHGVSASPTGLISRFFCHPILRTFGKYSYAMYLFNKPVDDYYWRFTHSYHWPLLGTSRLPEQIVRDGVCLTIVFVTSWLSWHLFEKWFLELKRYFPAAASDPADTTSLQSEDAAILRSSPQEA